MEATDQHFRKLHARLEYLVAHRRGNPLLRIISTYALKRPDTSRAPNTRWTSLIPSTWCLSLLVSVFIKSLPFQSCRLTRRALPKAQPCWAAPRTTRLCRELSLSWPRWRTRWSSYTRTRPPTTHSALQKSSQISSGCSEPSGYRQNPAFLPGWTDSAWGQIHFSQGVNKVGRDCFYF